MDNGSSTLLLFPSLLEPPGSNVSSPPPAEVPRSIEEDLYVRGASKRSSSSSNDLLYERDRFRARLQTFNGRQNDKMDTEDSPGTTESSKNGVIDEETSHCDVCDIIQLKTTRLQVRQPTPEFSNDNISPLSSDLVFFNSLSELPSSLSSSSFPMTIRSLTYAQLSAVFKYYFNQNLPQTEKMFPWLHGIHPDNFAQKRFFCRDTSDETDLGSEPPESNELNPSLSPDATTAPRFLMCVSPVDNPTLLRNTVHAPEILHPIDVSRAEVVRFLQYVLELVFPGKDQDHMLETIVADCYAIKHLPVFLNLDPSLGVSLRNFHIQVAKLAACSDMVIYCLDNEHLGSCKCASLARVLWLAQRYTFAKDGALDKMHYNTFIMSDLPFLEKILLRQSSPYHSTLFTVPPEPRNDTRKTLLELRLSSFNPKSLAVWDLDFVMKEKVETTRMSAALCIGGRVWAGNMWDYQAMIMHLQFRNEMSIGDGFGCYCSPSSSIVNKEDIANQSITKILPPPRANWRLFIHCCSDASFPDLAVLRLLMFKFSLSSHRSTGSEYHTLEFPPAGSVGIGDCKKENLMSVVNCCKLLYLYSLSTSDDPDVVSALIYCLDGYTELSLFVLSYVMYSRNVSLDEAMLLLHNDYLRPFYIFSSDVHILRKLEVLLRRVLPLVKKVEWSTLEVFSDLEITEILLATGSRPSHSVGAKHSLERKASSLSLLEADWVSDVDGSLPSRILPYLYLGSLKHANSLALLSKLGITKVISVGERLEWLNSRHFQSTHTISVEEIDNGNIEKFTISGNPSTVDTILKVNNLQDDGIDELSASLPRMLEFIEAEHQKSNGKAKIFVHCRVGVSRSATVVMAEVMRRLNVLLAKAYLYVRVRRLNIIIQPNLRFMYEVFKWEEQQKFLKKNKLDLTLREIDWFVFCREVMNLNVPYLRK